MVIFRHHLSEGPKILIDYNKNSETVSIGYWVNIGSRDELKSESGYSHFIEHMLFKGTKNRSGKDIALELDDLGGEINGATAKEFTYYYVNVAKNYFKDAIEVLTDMFFNAKFNQDDFIKEKSVIIDELEGTNDDPEDYINDLFSVTLWGDTPFGYPVIGRKEVIKELDTETLYRFYKNHYCADNLVVSVSGGVEPEFALSCIIEEIGKNKSSKECLTIKRERPVSKVKISIEGKDTEQAYFIAGRDSYSYRDDKRYSMMLLNSIVGGSFSSILFQEIRENLGLCYSISSGYLIYSDIGEFTVGFSSSLKNLLNVIEEINKKFAKIKKGLITEKDLIRAKRRLYGNFILAKESNEWLMSRIAINELIFGKVIPIEEVFDRINSVTMDNLYEVINEILIGDRFSIAVVYPDKQKIDMKNIKLDF